MGSSKKHKEKEKEHKRKKKHRSRSRSRERKHKKDKRDEKRPREDERNYDEGEIPGLDLLSVKKEETNHSGRVPQGWTRFLGYLERIVLEL